MTSNHCFSTSFLCELCDLLFNSFSAFYQLRCGARRVRSFCSKHTRSHDQARLKTAAWIYIFSPSAPATLRHSSMVEAKAAGVNVCEPSLTAFEGFG